MYLPYFLVVLYCIYNITAIIYILNERRRK